MRTFFFLLFSFILSLLVSCQKGSDTSEPSPQPQNQLKVDSSSLSLKGTIGSKDSFTIQSNVSWTLTITPTTWLQPSVTSGTGSAKVYLTILGINSGASTRTATITITPAAGTNLQPLTIIVNQPPLPLSSWNKVYGGSGADNGRSFLQGGDGKFNCLIAGYTKSKDGDLAGNRGGQDALLVKLDSNGNKLWQKVYGGSGDDQFNKVIGTLGGNMLIGYTSSNDGDVSGHHGGRDAWIINVDHSGNILWQIAVGGTGDDEALSVWEFGLAYYVVGYTKSTNGDFGPGNGGQDVWVLKIDGYGRKSWLKTFGGTLDDVASSITQTNDGHLLVAGTTFSNNGDMSGNHGGSDAFLLKVNPENGLKTWCKTFGGSQNDGANGVVWGAGFVFTGYTQSNDGDVTGNHGGQDAWVVRTDTDGAKIWSKTFGGTLTEEGACVANTNLGTYAITGYANSNNGDISGNRGEKDGLLLIVNDDGSLALSKTFGGTQNDSFAYVVQGFNCFYLVGSSFSNDGDISGSWGDQDVWLMKAPLK